MRAHLYFLENVRYFVIVLIVLSASILLPISSIHLNIAKASPTYSVSIIDNAFLPLRINITTGTVVTWTYTSSGHSAHTVTSNPQTNVTQSGTPLISSGQLNPGQSFSYSFNLPGYYPYQCSLHYTLASMNGWVMVTGNPVTSPPGPSNNSSLPWLLVSGIAVAAVAVILVALLSLKRRKVATP
jgi:plastocyanin